MIKLSILQLNRSFQKIFQRICKKITGFLIGTNNQIIDAPNLVIFRKRGIHLQFCFRRFGIAGIFCVSETSCV